MLNSVLVSDLRHARALMVQAIQLQNKALRASSVFDYSPGVMASRSRLFLTIVNLKKK
jgi:hypothetical protein